MLISYIIATTALLAAPPAFEIRDPESGQVLARGVELQQEADGTLRADTRYVDPQGNELQTETYEIDKTSKHLGRFHSRAPNGEEVEVCRQSDGTLELRFRADVDSSFSSKILSGNAETVMGKAFPSAILDHWQELVTGTPRVLDLIVPPLMQTIAFRIRFDDKASAPPHRMTFVAEADSWFIRQFAPDVTFRFSAGGDAASPRLIEVLGPTPVYLGGKRHRQVQIVILEK